MKTENNPQSDEPPSGSASSQNFQSGISFELSNILSDFEALKKEISDFKNHLTIDDFHFYARELQLEHTGTFEKRLDELCKKHFSVHWYELSDELKKQFLKASKNESVESCENINKLTHFFFGSVFSYEKKYDKKYKKTGQPDWRGAQNVEEILVWKGKFHVEQKELQKDDCLKNDLVILKPVTKNFYPKNWRNVLTTLIDSHWNTFSGNFDSSKGIWCYHNRDREKLTTTDYICFLALKNTLRSDLQIVTNEHEILIVVSGGIAAKIAIRKTGNYVSKILQLEQQIYSMANFSWKEKDYEYSEKTLLHISGYTDSQINIHIPNGYYFVGDKYIVQLEFIAAPILLNNPLIPVMCTDHSSLNLLEDEEEERKRRDEEDY